MLHWNGPKDSAVDENRPCQAKALGTLKILQDFTKNRVGHVKDQESA